MFRSEVPCPIDVFYVGADTDYGTDTGHPMPKGYLNTIEGTELDKTIGDEKVTAENAAALVTPGDPTGDLSSQIHHPANPAACHEHHSFHLGVNPAANPDNRMSPVRPNTDGTDGTEELLLLSTRLGKQKNR